MDKALQMISQHAEDGAKLRRDFFAVHGGKVAEAARRMAVGLFNPFSISAIISNASA